ncbi:8322_t:CDS:2, partial [Dentiscutata erythropus]
MSSVKGRVLLAYSGGLDTSCILAWLIEQNYEVITYMANVGQEEDFEAAREKALKIGAKKVYIEDLRRVFVEELIFPTIQANAIYENVYLLGTSIARPVIAKRQMEIAEKENCQYMSHGCTGKGNDQVRFELAYYALKPDIQVIAPWRIPEFYERFPGRQALLAYAAEKNIPVVQTVKKPWSTDENLYHISYEAGILEDPNVTPPKDMWKLTVDPEDAPNTPERITIAFEKGIPVMVKNHSDGTTVSDPLDLFIYLNTIARRNGIGRIDIVENRYIGIKSRGCYETPGGTILRAAHVDLEGLVLDRQVRNLRDQFITPQFSQLLYNGQYFSPERDVLSAALLESQKRVNGEVKLKLYKGNVIVEGRKSDTEKLYDMDESSMDVAGGFSPQDADGFIKIQSIRLKKWGKILESPVHLMLNAIPRTYETNSISPLSEMKQAIRFSKMHTYSPHSLTDNIYPYYFRAGSEPDNDDITVAAYITQDRLDDLIRLADIWKGTLNSIKNLYEKNLNVATYVDIHLIMGPYSTKNTTLQPVQTNIHMNTARLFARTEFIFFLDFDTWPTSGLRSRILNHSDLLLNNDVLILPTFTFANDAKDFSFPRGKQDVKRLVQSQLLGLKDKGWELNNGPTCLNQWMNSDEPYKVENYELHYTPNFVIRKSGKIP